MSNTERWYNLPQRIDTPLGKGTIRKRRLKPEHSTCMERKYEGLQVGRGQYFLAKTHFNHKDTQYRNGKITRYIGTIDDIIGDDLRCSVRQVSSISGRDKPVANKKAQGEARRQRIEAKSCFGLSGSKAYHKLKHSQSK